MRKLSSWRELLDSIVSDPAERRRIAMEIGVRTITLTRWINGESKPRLQNLHSLLRAVPKQYHDLFQELLENEEGFSSFITPGRDDWSEEIPPKFFDEVLNTRATTPDILRFWTISRMVLQHAIRQLDPEPLGMAITVVRCMPPFKDDKIRSLREGVGLGTLPWDTDLEQKAIFLGAESLAGFVVADARLATVQDLTVDRAYIPAYQTEYEVSAAAHPIMFAGRVAGCLLLSSTQRNYFLSPSQIALIHSYSNLISLAFEPEEFYPLDLIELRVMPSLEVQRKYLAGFRQRVLKLMKESAGTPRPLLNIEAEQMAWQQLEEILLNLPFQTS